MMLEQSKISKKNYAIWYKQFIDSHCPYYKYSYVTETVLYFHSFFTVFFPIIIYSYDIWQLKMV